MRLPLGIVLALVAIASHAATTSVDTPGVGIDCKRGTTVIKQDMADAAACKALALTDAESRKASANYWSAPNETKFAVTYKKPVVVPPVVVPPVVVPPPPPVVDMPPATPTNNMPYIDPAKIPAPVAGFSGPRVKAAPVIDTSGDGTGAFRVDVGVSHFAYDDPIVLPGEPGKSHLHMFFGSSGVNANTTDADIQNCKASTSEGGTLNCSSMWIPAVINTTTHGVVVPDHMGVYYKGPKDKTKKTLVMPPPGLRIVWGTPNATDFVDYWGQHPYWVCNVPGRDTIKDALIPADCPKGAEMRFVLDFPRCWDGKNLDSPNHNDHIKFEPESCPASHPVALTFVSYIVIFYSDGNTSNWKFSSDNYIGQGGWSAHGDYWAGWKPDIEAEWFTNCVANGGDCKGHYIGPSRTLY